MKKIYLLLLSICTTLAYSQAGAPANPYYSGFNWNLIGTALKSALATKTITKHTNLLSYTPGVWNASKITDLDPANSNNVLLVYGFENGTDSSVTNDRSRDKNNNGGNNGQWNREHVYAKSLGTPTLLDGGTANNTSSDAGEDAHHLRPADVQWNGIRGNTVFGTGSGNSGNVPNGWYPGDEWKGDVARMMMYMYLRYGNQCLPTNVGSGSSPASDSNMVNLFLQWNADDSVSAFEDTRNTYHGGTGTYSQGNRNPFIDNPYLATVIWGGPLAENRWPGLLSTDSYDILSNVTVYPIPSNDNKINIETELEIKEIELININGQILQMIKNPIASNRIYSLNDISRGFYFVKLTTSDNLVTTKRIIVN